MVEVRGELEDLHLHGSSFCSFPPKRQLLTMALERTLGATHWWWVINGER